MELCDFQIKTADEIKEELREFLNSGRISAAQYELLDPANLSEILSMPVFANLEKGRLFREQEFLCRLPAKEIFDTPADDGVLLQGAIDLLAETKDGYLIIDYKYSRKTDEQILSSYSRQLALYKKAVALIMRVEESSIGTVIVNIFKKRQINLF